MAVKAESGTGESLCCFRRMQVLRHDLNVNIRTLWSENQEAVPNNTAVEVRVHDSVFWRGRNTLDENITAFGKSLLGNRISEPEPH